MCAIVIIECSGCRLDLTELRVRHPKLELTGARQMGPGWFDFVVCSYDDGCLCPPGPPGMLASLESLLVDLQQNSNRVLYHPNDIDWDERQEVVSLDPVAALVYAPPHLGRAPLRVVIDGHL
ncbi:MAG: hypothetical protein AB7S38_05555 [Vulcanimicrobiota bacterium]